MKLLTYVIALLLIFAIPVSGANLILERQSSSERWTYGTLMIDDLSITTIENTSTLIPIGTYKIIISYSPRFDKKTPEILVKNHKGIRIHSVGKKFVLEGCIGVSRADYTKLRTKLDKNNTITITVAKPPQLKLTYLQILLVKLIALKVYLYRYAKMLHLSH